MREYTFEDFQAVRRADRALAVEDELDALVDRLSTLREGAKGKERDTYQAALASIFDAWQLVRDYAKALPVPQPTVTKKARKAA